MSSSERRNRRKTLIHSFIHSFIHSIMTVTRWPMSYCRILWVLDWTWVRSRYRPSAPLNGCQPILFNIVYVICTVLNYVSFSCNKYTWNLFIYYNVFVMYSRCLYLLTDISGYAYCVIFNSNILVGVGMTGSIQGLLVITIERYVKIVHSLLHKRYYRPWMLYVAVAIPWTNAVIHDCHVTPCFYFSPSFMLQWCIFFR